MWVQVETEEVYDGSVCISIHNAQLAQISQLHTLTSPQKYSTKTEYLNDGGESCFLSTG